MRLFPLPSCFGQRRLRRGLMVLAGGLALLAAPGAHAQRSGDFSMTYMQDSTRFVGNQGYPYFYLRGATTEIGYSFWKGVGFVAGASGEAGTNLRSNIDIHQVTFFVGPRYTWNIGHISPTAWNRKGGVFVEGKFGHTFAMAGQYPVNGVLATNASAADMEVGGGVNLHIYHRFDLRLIEGDGVRTKLPNGGTNTQNSFRISTGINFHIGY